MPDHTTNLVRYAFRKHRASVLDPILTPLNNPFLHTGTWTSEDLLNVNVRHNALDVVS